jgi:N-acetylmuramoyl-L-alanine amidase
MRPRLYRQARRRHTRNRSGRLPWNHRGWHAGGSANNSYIGFEMCEDGLDDKAYLASVYELAAQLCAWLCATYGIDVKNVIGHYEAHARGMASNHGDPRNWFKTARAIHG